MIGGYYQSVVSNVNLQPNFWFDPVQEGSVSTSGGRITTLTDRYGNTATFNGSGNELYADTWNGKPVVSCRGTGQLASTATRLLLSNPVPVVSGVIVLRSFNGSLTNMLIGMTQGTALADVFIQGSNISVDGTAGGAAIANVWVNGIQRAISGTAVPGPGRDFPGTYTTPLLLSFVYTDGNSKSLTTLFARAGSGFSPFADVAEIITSGKAWTTQELKYIEKQLALKWGITLVG